MLAGHELATSRFSWLAIIPTCLAKIGILVPVCGDCGVGGKLRVRHAMAAAAAVAGSLLLTAGCSSSSSGSGSASGNSGSGTNWATASSAAAGGGMNALAAAAKKEGTLNVITLPSNWANYGRIMKDFTAKYGIKINDANPDGSSQDELNAVNQLKGQDRAPDVLDVGTAFAVKGAQSGVLAPYKVASWDSIPADAKATDGTWFADYGGYVAIGYDTAKVKTPPTSFADLLKPAYKNEVAITATRPRPARRSRPCSRNRSAP
jgi:putative spermidine/putrescine transport system substrate-binding protein